MESEANTGRVVDSQCGRESLDERQGGLLTRFCCMASQSGVVDGGLKVVGQRYRFYAVDLPDGVLQLLRCEPRK